MRPQPGHTHALSALGLAVTLLTAGVARADEAPPPVEIPAGPPPNAVSVPLSNPTLLFGPQRAATFGLGFGKIGDSSYFQFSGYLNLVFGKLTLGISAPFNLLSPFPKPDPADKASAYGGVLRSQDWPKPSVDNYGHYLALVRNIQWGNPQDPFYVQYGQFFGATMGHGTIMDRYDNALDVNNPKPGLAAAVNSSKYGGLEVFTDDIAWPSTTILAARAYARPLGIAGFGPAGQKWAVGVTYAEDRLAPRQLLPIGSIISSDAAAGLTLSPPTDPRQSATVWGVDTEYEVFRNDIFGLTPYIDINNERT